MNFAMGPFSRFSRSYSQLYDHYGDFWRFRLSSLVGNEEKKDSKGVLRIPPPPNFISSVRKLNRNVDGILSRLVTGIQRVSGIPLEAQRRSFTPVQRRNKPRNGRQRRRQRQHHSNPRHDEPGPPPAVPEQHVEVVQALHEE